MTANDSPGPGQEQHGSGHPHSEHPGPRQDHGHGLGHDHGHGRGDHHGPTHDVRRAGWAKLRHAVAHFFGGHAHDAADQVDSALESHDEGRRALYLSLAILAVTAALQLVVAAISSSVALLGDGLHNVADALTAVPLLIAFSLARRPANDRFTYGYGRAEDLAGIFVILMIAGSSALAGYEAVLRLLDPRPVDHLWAVAVAALIGFVGNEVVARYRISVGRRIGSAALVADGLHARTDGFTSLAVIVGAAGVAAGLPWADPVVGLVITVAILAILRSAAMQVGARLLDAVDPELVAAARTAAGEVDGVLRVTALRLRWIGHRLHAEAAITVPDDVSVAAGHEIAHRAEERVRARLPRLDSATVHVGPPGRHAQIWRN